MRFIDVPTIFLSYAEDNADDNWQLLLKQNPVAKRVHGVRGFDSAHRAASEKAKTLKATPFFITVDGDNEVMSDFWELDTENIPPEFRLDTKAVLSWNAYNPMTGLCYGNGGLKLWTHSFIDQMVTHEQTEGKVVDFCWDPAYYQLHHIYSVTRPYGSARQAFCAGFREGVKMPLVEGKTLGSIYETAGKAYRLNLHRLVTWCSVGQHIPSGQHSVYGALYGFWSVHVKKSIPMEKVSDLSFISELFLEKENDNAEHEYPTAKSMREDILSKTGIDIPAFGEKQSRFIVESTKPYNLAPPFERETWPSPIDVKF